MPDFFSARFQTINDFFAAQATLPDNFWRDIFSWSYWTEPDLLTSSPYLVSFLLGTAIAIGLLVFWRQRLKKAQLVTPVFDEPISQLFTVIMLVVIMTLSYLFFRSQGIVYFSSRLTILATIAVTGIWAIVIAVYIRRVSLARREAYLEKERFFRYLPKKKVKP